MTVRGAGFARAQGLLRCPLCHSALRLAESGSFLCDQRHCFDISAKGYVNFAPKQGPTKYDRALFESRTAVYRAGYYEEVLRAVTQLAAACAPGDWVLDAGCGEGYYAAGAAAAGCRTLAFDLSRDAVRLAARGGGNDIVWMVADLTNIPLRDGGAAAVLNVFSPAHYGEFARVLRPGGALIKVVPGAAHLRELRQAAGLGDRPYSNRPVLEHFQRHFRAEERREVCATLPVPPDMREHLLRMSPLLFGVEAGELRGRELQSITIHAEILLGRAE